MLQKNGDEKILNKEEFENMLSRDEESKLVARQNELKVMAYDANVLINEMNLKLRDIENAISMIGVEIEKKKLLAPNLILQKDDLNKSN